MFCICVLGLLIIFDYEFFVVKIYMLWIFDEISGEIEIDVWFGYFKIIYIYFNCENYDFWVLVLGFVFI